MVVYVPYTCLCNVGWRSVETRINVEVSTFLISWNEIQASWELPIVKRLMNLRMYVLYNQRVLM